MKARHLGCIVLVAILALPPLVAAEDEPNGGLFVAFRKRIDMNDGSIDHDVYAQRVTPTGQAAWGAKRRHLPVGDSRMHDGEPAACRDGRGGAIVAYVMRRVVDGKTTEASLYAQRVDAEGKRHWFTRRVPAKVAPGSGLQRHPAILSDGEGGAFVAFVWVLPNQKQAVILQRIGPGGNRVWPKERRPVLVGRTRACDRAPVLVPDGEGGVLVLYESERKGGNRDVWASRVRADGTFAWRGEGKPTAVAATDHQERRVTAVSDGEGGVIAAFELEITSGDAKGDVEIYAQRISADGIRRWRSGKVPTGVSMLPGRETRPVAVADGAGGVFVAFERVNPPGDREGDTDILAQRLDASGRRLWNEGRRAMVVAAGDAHERAPVAVPTGDGGMIIVHEIEPRDGPRKGHVDVAAQRLSADGTRMWHEGKRSPVVFGYDLREYTPLAVSDGEGGVYVVACVDAPTTEGISGVVLLLVRRVGSSGGLFWDRTTRPSVGHCVGPELQPTALLLGSPSPLPSSAPPREASQ